MIQQIFEFIWFAFYFMMWNWHGWLYGSIINLAITQLFKTLMHRVFNYEPLNEMDRVSTHDDPKYFLSNLVGCCFFDKFEYDKMKNHLLKKTKTINRMRHLKVKFFSTHFFKLMNE